MPESGKKGLYQLGCKDADDSPNDGIYEDNVNVAKSLQLEQQRLGQLSHTAKSERAVTATKQSFGSLNSGFNCFEDIALRQSKHSSSQILQIGAGQNIEIEKLVLRAESLQATDS